MTISDLIIHLTKVLAKDGDMPVLVCPHNEGYELNSALTDVFASEIRNGKVRDGNNLAFVIG